MTDERLRGLRSRIREIRDFPREGIVFKDITPLLADVDAFRTCLQLMVEALDGAPVSAVVGIESRGFMFGAALADRLGVGFVPVRKPGKLPAPTYRAEYELEYGRDAVEIHRDALRSGDHVVVVDDLIATGGTAKATDELVRRCGAEVEAFVFVINLAALEGIAKLAPRRVITILDYD
jgi:adenine phosphoribosyltransferase